MHNLGHLEKTLVGEVGSKLLKSFISSESAVRAKNYLHNANCNAR